MTKAVKIAVAWLLEEDWPKWQAIDSQLPDHSRWLAKIESAEAKAKSEGMHTERIVVTPDRFVEWCSANGKAIDRNSRAEYAAKTLMIRITAH